MPKYCPNTVCMGRLTVKCGQYACFECGFRGKGSLTWADKIPLKIAELNSLNANFRANIMSNTLEINRLNRQLDQLEPEENL